MATHQVNLSTLNREELIELAKRQATQIKEKNLRLQEFCKMQNTNVSEQQNIIDHLKADLLQKMQQITEMETKMTNWKIKVMAITQQDAKTIESLKEELEAAKNRQGPFGRNTNASAPSELKQLVDSVKKDATTIQPQHEGILLQRLSAAEAEVARVTAESAELRSQIESLQSAQSDEGSRAAAQLAAAEAEVARVTAESAELRSQIESLQSAQSDEGSRAAAQLAAAEAEVARVTAESAELRSQIESLQSAQSDEGSRAAAQLAAAEAEVARVTAESAELRSQIAHFQSLNVAGSSVVDNVNVFSADYVSRLKAKMDDWKSKIKVIADSDAKKIADLEVQVSERQQALDEVRQRYTEEKEVTARMAQVIIRVGKAAIASQT